MKQKSTVHEERHTVELTGRAEEHVRRLADRWGCTLEEVVTRLIDREFARVCEIERLGRRDA